MGKRFHVWEAEYPEEGSTLLKADTAEAAKAAYEQMTGENETELDAVECNANCPCRACELLERQEKRDAAETESLRAQLQEALERAEKAESTLAEWERYRDQDHEMGRKWTPEYSCGDNLCSFRTSRNGMGTNGGCRCHENSGAARKVFRLLRAELRTEREKVMKLETDHTDSEKSLIASIGRLDERLVKEQQKTARLEKSLADHIAYATRIEAETLETVIGILFEECQPNYGYLFSRMDDRLRALANPSEKEEKVTIPVEAATLSGSNPRQNSMKWLAKIRMLSLKESERRNSMGKYMTFDEYLYDAQRTERVYENKELTLAVLSMGLAGESGELIDMLKKVVGHGHTLDIMHVEKELGDVLWYWTMLCKYFNLDPGQVAETNLNKLRLRYPEGFSTEASVNRKAEDP